ncbi:MAG: heavy-metal-associated domain-containing protein [Nitrososphaeria archaeon]
MKSKTVLLEGPFCQPCIRKLLKYVKSVDGVVDAKVNIVAGLLVVYFEKDIDILKVKAAVEEAGFNFLGVGG